MRHHTRAASMYLVMSELCCYSTHVFPCKTSIQLTGQSQPESSIAEFSSLTKYHRFSAEMNSQVNAINMKTKQLSMGSSRLIASANNTVKKRKLAYVTNLLVPSFRALFRAMNTCKLLKNVYAVKKATPFLLLLYLR